ncbi:hypothetical protein CMI46_00015 [Candidatus Pacearchaeota archaeon]|nr:hypothetical protein [Candidatus Pacearchaeota archaeon]|tara:strand:+ start:682 stop:1203 length:522 start_codon:yes stop_codon:yes gene_type:complete
MKKTIIALSTILVILVIVGAITAYLLIPSKTDYVNTYEPTWAQENLDSLEIDAGVVGYTLAQFQVNNLRNVPLTKNTPKMEITIDGVVYVVEVESGQILSSQSSTDEEDLRISMTREDVINILDESNDATTEIQKAVNEGTITVETVAGKPELLAKGYLGLYKTITGEDLEED